MKLYFVEKARDNSPGDKLSSPLQSLAAAESIANTSGPEIEIDPYEGTLVKLAKYSTPKLNTAYGEVSDDPDDFDAISEVETDEEAE